MVRRQVGQRADEGRAVVQALGPLDARHAQLFRFLQVLQIQLEQGLDVVGREGDGDEQEVVVLLLGVTFDDVGRLRAQPRRRTDLGLPDEPVRVRVAERVHDGVHGGADFGGVRVASVDDGHGQRVGGEDDGDGVADVFRVSRQRFLNVDLDGLCCFSSVLF